MITVPRRRPTRAPNPSAAGCSTPSSRRLSVYRRHHDASGPPDDAASAAIADDLVLARYRAALDDVYGDVIEQVVLFGSRARGDVRPDSDYDVAVFLKAMPDRWEELRRLADLKVDVFDEVGVIFDAKPFRADSYRDRTPIMHEIRRDGRDL